MANLVTSEKILPLIEPVLDNSNIIKIKDTSKILEYRIESDNRASDRVKVENILSFTLNSFEPLGPVTVIILLSTLIEESFGNKIDFFPIFDIKIPYKLLLHLYYFFWHRYQTLRL